MYICNISYRNAYKIACQYAVKVVKLSNSELNNLIILFWFSNESLTFPSCIRRITSRNSEDQFSDYSAPSLGLSIRQIYDFEMVLILHVVVDNVIVGPGTVLSCNHEVTMIKDNRR